MQIEFAVEGRAVPQGSHTVMRGRLIQVNSAKHKAWRRQLLLAAVAARPPDWDSSKAKVVEAVFGFKRPKSHLTKAGGLRKGAPEAMWMRPDLDKLARSVGDALTDALVVNDDSQITRWVLEKMFHSEDFALVTVRDWT